MKLFSYLRLPFRDIWRNRRRTLVTLITIMIGEMAVLIFGGYASAVVHGVQTGVVRQVGHLQLQRPGFFTIGTSTPADYGISDYNAIIKLLEADPVLKPMLKVATSQLQLQGIVGDFNLGVSRSVAGVGYDARDQNKMRQWNEYEFPGVIPPIALPENQANVLSIGIGVARSLHLCGVLNVPSCASDPLPAKKVSNGAAAPDDIDALLDVHAKESAPSTPLQSGPRLDVLAATSGGAPNVLNARVAAAESLGVKEIDDSYLAMPLEMAQQLVYGRDKPQVTSVVIQLNESSQVEPAREHLKALIKAKGWDLEVMDYRTLYPVYDQIAGLFGSIFGFVSMLIGVIVLFSVANTMSASVMERTVEIGTLRSMGMRRSGIARQFISEGLLIGIMGTLLGGALALLCAYFINSAGLTWTPPNSIDKNPLVVHVFNSPGLMFGSLLILITLAAVSSLLPAYRAARIPVVEALRHV
jgi:putative ABC transport system permease protein